MGAADSFNTVATVIFAAAVVHTLFAGKLTEVVFALWAIPLMLAFGLMRGWGAAFRYLTDTVVYDEALFVTVIMLLAVTRPIERLAETVLRRVAGIGGGTPTAWWMTILIVGPLLGSFITEPGAMTVAAVLLARQFYALQPPRRLRYATLGLLFVNVSIGGTLTHFAAPPVLMVARPWGWDTPFMLQQFGWRAALAILASTCVYAWIFRRDLAALVPGSREQTTGAPWWVTLVHTGLMGWTVVNAHNPLLIIGGLALFLLFASATSMHQGRLQVHGPVFVGIFLAGLVIHGGLQAWWIQPLLARLSESGLFLGAAVLTAFNDNALITFLATLVPDLGDAQKLAVMQGAVTGGGLTVIANAPNPAGQALLVRFFDGGVNPLRLALAALLPTLIAAAAFRLL